MTQGNVLFLFPVITDHMLQMKARLKSMIVLCFFLPLIGAPVFDDFYANV